MSTYHKKFLNVNEQIDRIISKKMVISLQSYLGSFQSNNRQYCKADIEQLLGVKITNFSNYLAALTHPSFKGQMFNDLMTTEHYQRLEFVGDALLNTIVALYLFDRYPKQSEGFYSRLKIKIIQTKNLAMYSRNLKLNDYVLVAPYHEAYRHTSDHLHEDLFEAIVGAIYQDAGFDTCKSWLLGVIEKYTPFEAYILLQDNYKDTLMRYYKAEKIDDFPRYFDCISTVAHSFTVAVILPRRALSQEVPKPHIELQSTKDLYHYFKCQLKECVIVGLGTGNKKKVAEQMAAKDALINLGVPFNY